MTNHRSLLRGIQGADDALIYLGGSPHPSPGRDGLAMTKHFIANMTLAGFDFADRLSMHRYALCLTFSLL